MVCSEVREDVGVGSRGRSPWIVRGPPKAGLAASINIYPIGFQWM